MSDPMTTIKSRLNLWFGDMPSTNVKTVAVIGLAYFTLGWLMAANLLGKSIDNVALGLWLGFLAGAWGFAYASFAKQRATDYGALDRQAVIEQAKSAGPATTVLATGDTKVTGAPVTITETAP